MKNTYGDFQGTELDPSLDFDYDEEEPTDLVQILGLAAGLAAIVGAILVLLGRRKQPTVRERAEEILASATKESKKGAKAASKAVGEAKLGDILEDALVRAHKIGSEADVVGLLEQARTKVSKAIERVDVSEVANGAGKGAAVAAGLGTMLGEAIDKAREAASHVDVSGLEDAAHEAGKRAAKVVSNGHLPEVDADKARNFLDDLKEKLVDAIDSVRNEVAPKAADTLMSEVLPAVQETAQAVVRKVHEDVMPAAQELAEEEVMPRARKAASAASQGAGSLNNILRSVVLSVIEKMVEDVLPGAKKAGSKAMHTAREEVIPAAAETAGEAAHKVRDDVLPKVGAAAAQTPDLLSDILGMAREKVAEAIDKAQPKVADAAHSAKEMADSGRHGVTGAVSSAGHGVTGAVSSAGRGVKRGVGGAVGATTHATREFTGILFWLGMLGGVILLVFVPDREKQEEVWNNIRQFLGEVREMWRDLQGPAPEFEDTTTV